MPAQKRSGFTLIELMIAISIIAIIAAIGSITYSQSQKLARDSRRKEDLKQIASAIQLFNADKKRYPCSGAGWVTSADSTWISDSNTVGCGGTGTSISPAYASSLPKDPLGTDTTTPWLTSGYGYWSINAAWGTGTAVCPQGTYYILVTQLENSSDPDSLGKQPNQTKTICGNSLTQPVWSTNSFILSVP